MFFEEEGELDSSVNTIKHDRVFDKLREDMERAAASADAENNTAAVTEAAAEPNCRRAQLLARRLAQSAREQVVEGRDTFEQKVDKEIVR